MSEYMLETNVARGFAETVELVRDALTGQGFGILTEIDMSAILKAKLDVDVPPQIILGACRPALAHQALLADPSIAVFLPCNVVVRAGATGSTVVEAFDPAFLAWLSGDETARTVASDAHERLTNVLDTISKDD